MTTITKERIDLFIKAPLENGLTRGEQMELARIALASLEVAPVGEVSEKRRGLIMDGTVDLGGKSTFRIIKGEKAMKRLPLGTKFYIAPPAPVVPEEIPKGLAGQIVSLLAHNIGDKFLAQKIWNACRTAMLQGGQPVSNRDELQVIGWLRSDYNSDDKRDPNAPLFMLGSNDPSEAWGVKYIPLSGNSPVIPDDWVMVPKKLTAENGAKSLLSGEFLETTFISCPECFADEECESCDGSGRIKIEVPVSWTTIKAIWNKGVEHFRSSTATGDN
ncbi:molecular chaperone DnaJ [Salmonella enterica]|nr:molecular chaperone DnaJ [Salmonella enterica]